MEKNFLSALTASILLISDLYAQDWNEIAKIVASDREMEATFGQDVCISGDYAIVGAWLEDKDTSGGNLLENAGAAYIYERDNAGNWPQVQKLVASDRSAFDYFGISVSVSGNYAIIGAHGRDGSFADVGAAYIFKRTASGTWTEVQKIAESDGIGVDAFGYEVKIFNTLAIVGAYARDEGNVSNAGAAYIFELDNSNLWQQTAKLVAGDKEVDDQFGYAVSISDSFAIVGALSEDHFDTLGTTLLIDAGCAYIFKRNSSGNWIEVKKLIASDGNTGDLFGASLALSGDYAIIGSPNEDEDPSGTNSITDAGSAYIFHYSDDDWTELEKVVALDRSASDNFGYKVSIAQNYAIAGSLFDDEDASGGNAVTNAGSAYIFKLDTTSGLWFQHQKIVASDRFPEDWFSYSVDIDGKYAISGASLEDEDATGGNTLTSSGSVYIFCAQSIFYADNDSDSYGDPNDSILTCFDLPPLGYVTNNLECDDTNPLIHPGVLDLCNGLDDDCDQPTLIDEDAVFLNWYQDFDNDSFGNPNVIHYGCDTLPGYVEDNTDCDDNDPLVHEPLPYFVDSDIDSFGSTIIEFKCSSIAPTGYSEDSTDCNDNDPTVYPGAVEILNDSIDQDCNGVDSTDMGIGIGSTETQQPTFSVYPNPTYGTFIIEFQTPDNINDEVLLQVVNPIGQVVIEERLKLKEGVLKKEIQFSSATAGGLYIVRLVVNGQFYRWKLPYTASQ